MPCRNKYMSHRITLTAPNKQQKKQYTPFLVKPMPEVYLTGTGVSWCIWTLCCNPPASEKVLLTAQCMHQLRNCQRNNCQSCKAARCSGKYEILLLSSFGPLLLGRAGHAGSARGWQRWESTDGADRTRGGESDPSLIGRKKNPKFETL